MKKSTVSKALALIFCFVILFMLLGSVGFLAVNAEHECSGCHCDICRQVKGCENLLVAVILSAVTVAFLLAVTSFYLAAEEKKPELCHRTLVFNKVKLSD